MDGEFRSPESRVLRPIEPLELPGFAPPQIDTAAPQCIVVDPRELLVDEAYQRGLSDRGRALILRIAAGWDWRKFKPPVVARVAASGGLSERSRFLIVDGQHTAIGAATAGIRGLPVMVNDGLSTGDQAQAFLGHNRDRLNLTPMQLHFAAFVAGEPAAVAVHRVCFEAGAKVLKSQAGKNAWKAGDTVAVAAIAGLIARRGEADAIRALKLLTAAGAAPITAPWLKAIEILLWQPGYGCEDAAIVEALSLAGFPHLGQQAAVWAAAHDSRLHEALAVVTQRTIGKLKAPGA